jgi:hypothetical protein
LLSDAEIDERRVDRRMENMVYFAGRQPTQKGMVLVPCRVVVLF